ncbi:hypothetical protein LTR66_005694 [Elasticomyces elasticus]|nr:hypothetical protein LTR66_005694 [Elasticomyces elasticus]
MSTTSHANVASSPLSFSVKAYAAKFRALLDSWHSLLLRFSDLVIDWTPFTLVVTYYIVCTAIYTSCSEQYIKVFYFFFMIANFYIAATCVIEAFLGMSPVREARQASISVERDGKFPTPDEGLPIMDLVIVAYLPNEQDIVKEQVQYALDNVIYPRDKLRVNLVYNTPMPIESLETELRHMETKFAELRVIKVFGSKSKADNLNHFFTLDTGADIIAIFDCDHFPHPHNARWAAERFVSDAALDIVQGRCVVYNAKESFWTRMIAIEFDKVYAVSHPGRNRLFGFGLFCGSNGYWRADLLRGHKMDREMLTEDIDSALRAYGQNKKAVHDMNVISYELAPTTFAAFWKQRMRWAQGWTQASIRHMPLIWSQPPTGTRGINERFGMLSLLPVREISYYLVTQHTCLLLSFIITCWPRNPTELVRLLFFRYPLAQWFFFITVICLIFTLWITNRVRSEFTTWPMMVLFSVVYPPYLILMATMGLYGHARQIIGYSSWNPTSRK